MYFFGAVMFEFDLSMDQTDEHMRHRVVNPPPVSNRTFVLPTVRPDGPSVLQQLRERERTASATPLIVSHSSGLNLAYLEASVYSELIPSEGVTFLSISGGGGALLPPSDEILSLPPVRPKVPSQQGPGWGGARDVFELEGRSEVGVAAVLRGIVSRIFSVSPATDLRDLLLVNAGDVSFKHFARTEPESSTCSLVVAPRSGMV